MMYDLHIAAVIMLLAFTTNVKSVPVPTESWSSGRLECTNTTSLIYQPGNIYEYDYNAKTVTKMDGTLEDIKQIVIDTKVEIIPLDKCDFILRLTDTKITHGGTIARKSSLTDDLIRHTLRFYFQNGTIKDIFPNDMESTRSLNIKRGILSAFQSISTQENLPLRLKETDVTGICLTEYSLNKTNNDTLVWDKKKDMRSCKDGKEHHESRADKKFLYTTQSSVFMTNSHDCQQKTNITSNLLLVSNCSEEYRLKAFSNNNTGVMTLSTRLLSFRILRKAKNNFDAGVVNRRTNLLFEPDNNGNMEYQYSKVLVKISEMELEYIFQKLCEIAKTDIGPEVPALFNDVVRYMRHLDEQGLNRIYKKITKVTFCKPISTKIKQFFYDAIPMVGSSASVRIIKNFILEKTVKESVKGTWLQSLSSIPAPCLDMVASVNVLLESDDVSSDVVQAVSYLANTYCREFPGCTEELPVQKTAEKLLQLINDCDIQEDDEQKVIAALRTVGNIVDSERAVDILSSCFSIEELAMEVRLAAVDTFAQLSCSANRSDLINLFLDASEDNEIRIAAYMSLMKCPSELFFINIQELLEIEKSSQVGSFVWSHLHNLRRTPDFDHILDNETLKEEFGEVNLKLSRNYDRMTYLEGINANIKMVSNLISTDNSFIPRAANLNLSLELFGRHFNLLEVGARGEGLETLLKGYFNLSEYFEKRIPLLNISQKGEFYDSEDENERENLKGSAYLKLFGKEFVFWKFRRQKNISLLASFTASSFFKRLNKDGRVELNKNMVLVDTGLIVPTCLGLPLTLSLTATASMATLVKGGLKMSSLTDIDINGDIKMSAAVSVIGQMNVDAFVTKSGVKTVMTAHTNLGAKLVFQLKKGEILESYFELPLQQSKIISLRSDIFIIRGKTERKQKLVPNNVIRSKTCTGDTLKTITGLRLCQQSLFPKSYFHRDSSVFPVTGPAMYNLHLINEDALEDYKLILVLKKDKLAFTFDTPSSKVPRRILIEMTTSAKRLVNVTLHLPWRNIQLNVNFNQLNDRISASSSLEIGKQSYFLKYLFVKEIKKGNLVRLKPSFQIKLHKKSFLDLSGEVFYQQGRQFGFGFKMISLFAKPVTLNGALKLINSQSKTKPTVNLSLKGPLIHIRIDGYFEPRKNGYVSRSSLKYRIDRYSDRLILWTRLRNLSSTTTLALFHSSLQFTSKMNPSRNLQILGTFSMTNKQLAVNMDAEIGSKKVPFSRVLIKTVLNFKYLNSIMKYLNISFNVANRKKNIDFGIKLDHFHMNKLFVAKADNRLLIKLSSNRTISSVIHFSKVIVNGMRRQRISLKLSKANGSIEFVNRLIQTAKKVYDNNISVYYEGQNKNRNFSVRTLYKNHAKGMHEVVNFILFNNSRYANMSGRLHYSSNFILVSGTVETDPESLFKKPLNSSMEVKMFYAKKLANGSFVIRVSPQNKISAQLSLAPTSTSYQLNITSLISPLIDVSSEGKVSITRKGLASSFVYGWNKRYSIRQQTSLIYSPLSFTLKARTCTENKISNLDVSFSKNGTKTQSFTYFKANLVSRIQSNYFFFTKYKEIFKFNIEFGNAFRTRPSIPSTNTFMKSAVQTTYGNFETDFFLSKTTKTITCILSHKMNDKKYEIDARYEGLNRIAMKIIFSDKLLLNTKLKFDRLKYNFNQNVILILFGKNYELRVTYKHQFQFDAKLVAPSSSGLLFVHIDKQFEQFDVFLEYYDRKEKYELNMAYNGYRQMKVAVTAPDSTYSATFNLFGDYSHFNLLLGFQLSKSKYELVVSNKDYNKEVRAQLTLPKVTLSLVITQVGKMDELKVLLKVTHNKIRYDFVSYIDRIDKTFSIVLKSPVTIESLTLNFNENLTLAIKHNRTDVLMINATRNHFDLDFTYPRNYSRIRFDGDLRSFQANLYLFLNDEKYAVIILNEDYFRNMRFLLSTPRYQDIITVTRKGNLGNFKVELSLQHNNITVGYRVSLVTYSQTFVLRSDLESPFFNDSLRMSFTGKPRKFFTYGELIHNDKVFRTSISNQDFFRRLDLQLASPQLKLTYSFDGPIKDLNSQMLMNFRNKSYTVFVAIRNYYRKIQFNSITPRFGHKNVSYILGPIMPVDGFPVDYIERDNIYKLTLSSGNVDQHFKLLLHSKRIGNNRTLLITDWNFRNIDQSVQLIHNDTYHSLTSSHLKAYTSHINGETERDENNFEVRFIDIPNNR